MAKKRSAAHRPPPAAKAIPTSSPRFALTIALIFCAAILAYLPAINGDFIWDDDAHVTKPELESLNGLGRIWFELDATQQYYPLLHSAFWIERRGPETPWAHLEAALRIKPDLQPARQLIDKLTSNHLHR